MSRPHIPASLRTFVFERAAGRCEYCRIHQDDVASRHPLDHITPVSHGGETDETNLALACLLCNTAKGSNLSGIDPLTGRVVALYDPRRQKWSRHFAIEGATIVGLTATGRTTVRVLRLNDLRRSDERLRLQAINRYPRR